MSLIKINITVYIAGTSPMLWAHELLLLHALMSAGTFCRHASIVILPPPSSLNRAPYFMADMPDSTPVESVFDWFLGWSRSYDNDHRKKWQKLQGKFVHSLYMWINGKLSWGNQVFRASCLVLVQGLPDLLCQCISGKIKLVFTSHFNSSPKNVWRAELISQFFCNLNSSKNFTCPLGTLRTEFTSPIAKSTSPGYWTLLSLHTD